ncbi:ABC transporter ATP-binding protein [Actinomadura rudentiformis]|uniref:ABC transporter ATP-binding protein n=2 Tax=Actinomadura rudentiformis TaxID=359158 RepID=A0A6H9YZR4_9ACTN|nr:ABC transporter ATP-binding protein [Actinomadura rudentiformis]
MAGERRAAFDHLRLEGVTRRFGSAVALSELDLRIEGGEFLALLGPSGCGKSTALNCLAGLLPLSAGSIWLDGERIDGLPPERRGFGMVFQNYALFPHLSVRRNVAFGLSVRRVGKAEIRRRVDEALALVELTEHAGKLPGQLSGGQQQRVAIARAVVLRPRLVLMDEPLSNLDAKLRVQMRTEIRRMHQDLGLTTVYVTHDQEEALALADRLVVLRAGKVEQIGTPEEVYTYPSSTYIAGFMGYRNLLGLPAVTTENGRVVVGEGAFRLTGVPQERVSGPRAVAAVRPEDFRRAGPGDRNTLDVRVEVSEFHGREVAAEGVTEGGHVIHFRLPERVAPGERIELAVPVERVLVFAGTGAGTRAGTGARTGEAAGPADAAGPEEA